jgi:hypothetical protein
MAGTQVGRVVGLLQGARARADQFAGQNELHQLQNELRSGLRDLDAVKSELAVSLSSRGVVGRQLGATVPGVNRATVSPMTTHTMLTGGTAAGSLAALGTMGLPVGRPAGGDDDGTNVDGTTNAAGSEGLSWTSSPGSPIHAPPRTLPPVYPTVAAVAESEWESQGIAFRSRAEQGSGLANASDQATTGSALLASLLRQSLVFDQYDRVVADQDEALQSKISQIKQKARDQVSASSDTEVPR